MIFINKTVDIRTDLRHHSPVMRSTSPRILLAFDWYDQRIYRGVARYAGEHKWHLSPYLFSDRYIPHGWPADGAITCYGKVLGKFIMSLNMPKIDISVSKIPEKIPRVRVNNEIIGRLAAKHFLERGYRHFAFYNWSIVDVNMLRREAFFNALKAAGVPAANLHIINQPSAAVLRNWPAHQNAMLKQLRKLPRPLAVFAGQDNLGVTLIEICERSGIHVPEEVSVLGVDNIEFLCECLTVPLSSIDTRLEDLGYKAARQLDRLMNGEITTSELDLLIAPNGIVTRQSTDVLAIEHPAVVRALQFMKTHIADPIALSDIAAYVKMSKRGLEKAFLKHLDRTPAAELRRLRLDTAKQLLTETNDKTEAIARACGYSNSSNLSYAFAKDTGLSPRAYRLKYRAEQK